VLKKSQTAARVVVLGSALLPFVSPVAAGSGPSHVVATLVSEQDAIVPGQPFRVGLRLEMAEGWHTYWTNPGDAGLPPRLTWRLPEGFTAGPLAFPIPKRIAVPPLMSYGYEGEAIFPVAIEAPAGLVPGAETTLGARANWVECREVCLPGKAEVSLTLPVRGAAGPTAQAPMFEAFRKAQPSAGDRLSLKAATAAGQILLSFGAPGGSAFSGAYFFAADPLTVEHAAPQKLHAGREGNRLDAPLATTRTEPLTRLRGLLVLEGKDAGAIAIDLPVEALAAIPPPPVSATQGPATGGSRLAMALVFAFLGGLILNLMPCVLPVLSLKVLGFVKQAGDDRERARLHGLVFTLGVLVSFWILAGVLLGLRAGGQQIGWGFQLQSPPFVVFLSFLFLLLALNLFGVFEVGESLVAAGNLAVGRQGLAHSFWNGALATLVATPCTAPFMGSALGYGLSQPAAVSLAIFTALGLGMAAPYLVLSWQPSLLRFVPRPGPWMEGFKQLMGFFLLGTALALVWVLGRQVGVDAMAILLGALLLAGVGGWVWGRPSRSRAGRVARGLVAAALALAGLAIGLTYAKRGPEAGGVRSAAVEVPREAGWETWSPARVDELRKAGRPVFVDFTAAWCLTCQVNAKVALETRAVGDRFAQYGVALLKADWTTGDDQITKALASYGRQGVPAYVLYGREPQAEPRLLPEVLTPGIVVAALDEMLGPAVAEAR
jgi:thiol:disulfide interchange protein/DsbC/DsbD-like thiol-disulfide interchange protein